MIEADYMIKPWICAFLAIRASRESWMANFQDEEQARVVPGVVFAIRQNLHLSSEVYIDTRGNEMSRTTAFRNRQRNGSRRCGGHIETGA